MIDKIILVPNKDLAPVEIEWSDESDDYVCKIPEGITRMDLIDVLEEIKRITLM